MNSIRIILSVILGVMTTWVFMGTLALNVVTASTIVILYATVVTLRTCYMRYEIDKAVHRFRENQEMLQNTKCVKFIDMLSSVIARFLCIGIGIMILYTVTPLSPLLYFAACITMVDMAEQVIRDEKAKKIWEEENNPSEEDTK